MRVLTMLVVAVLLAGAPLAAEAALLSGPVPADKYITFDGLDWAWASPASGAGFLPLDINAPGDGWRIATEDEFLNHRPDASDFFVDEVWRCASAYFTPYAHCDEGDGAAGTIARDFFPSAGTSANGLYDCNQVPCEIWVVRGESGPGPDPSVPAPAALVLLGLGLAVAAPTMRRRR